MSRRIRAEYVPRSGSEWGEFAGSFLVVSRLVRYHYSDSLKWQPLSPINCEKWEIENV